MSTLMQASRQWATRPADERFTSLHALASYAHYEKDHSRQGVVSSRRIEAAPDPADDKEGIVVIGPNGHPANPTHYAFGQLAQRAGAPSDYLRGLPAPLAADCINWGLKSREIEDVGILLTKNGGPAALRAVTGPNYGRIWNAEIADTLVRNFGDGVSGDWRVPGEFGKRVQVTQDNTTLYCGDRSMFVFLADEEHRITVKNRRDGLDGTVARGFFAWNSEVGAATAGLGFFGFDYACSNRIVWGAVDYTEVRIRHTSGAPDRWLEELRPALIRYANSAVGPQEAMIRNAQEKRIDDIDSFLASRKFTARVIDNAKTIHMAEEHRPIETIWDAVTGLTALARGIANQPERVALERSAGDLLRLAA